MDLYRLKRAFLSYVTNDLETADPSYVKEVLTDVCGLNNEELDELGLLGLFPDDFDDE